MEPNGKQKKECCLTTPKDSEMRSKYVEYLRSQVQLVSPAGIIILGVLTLISLIPAITNKQFQVLGETIKPDVGVFFLSLAFTANISVCYLISRKHPIASEFVSPLLTICFILFCVPTYYERDAKKATILTKNTLFQTINMGYMFNFIVSCFFSASYLPALASRLVLDVFFIHLCVRRITSGDITALPVIYNFLLTVVVLELNAYIINRKTL